MPDLPFHIISDTHFWHDDIVRFTQRPGYDPRYGLHDVNKHNQLMFDNWHDNVLDVDTVVHLGDLCLRSKDEDMRRRQEETLANLPGDKKLMLGNHDGYEKDWYEDLGFEVIDPFDLTWKDMQIIFTHYPLKGINKNINKQINVHGHIHNNYVDHITRNHVNVCVELRAFCPIPIEPLLNTAVYRAQLEDKRRDFGPVGRFSNYV